MSRVFYPGSFDPVTNGHVNLMERASQIFDEIVVGVYAKPSQKAFFTVDERVNLLKEATSHLNVEIISYTDKLTVDIAKRLNAGVLLRGLRIGSDFEYEREMALSNRALEKRIDTLFLMSSLEYQFVSSSRVKEIAQLGGDISSLVPRNVLESLVANIQRFGIKG